MLDRLEEAGHLKRVPSEEDRRKIIIRLAEKDKRMRDGGGNMKEKKELTAPCGMDCFNCEIQEANLTSETAAVLQGKYGWPKEEIACKGC